MCFFMHQGGAGVANPSKRSQGGGQGQHWPPLLFEENTFNKYRKTSKA